jgi:hypothetical protein
LQRALQLPVVTALLTLLRLRNAHPAFQGRFSIAAGPAHTLALSWNAEAHFIRLEVDVEDMRAVVSCSEHGATAGTRVLELTGSHGDNAEAWLRAPDAR